MSTPDTTLDARFSDSGAAAAGWDETRRALEEAQLSWICTVHSDGRPHLTPLVAVWLDEALYFSTAGAPTDISGVGGGSQSVFYCVSGTTTVTTGF